MTIRLRYFISLFLIFQTLPAHSQDDIPPDRAFITYVTVDTATNNNEIYWTPSESPDLKHYNLYFEINTLNGPEGVFIESVGRDQTSYTHAVGSAGSQNFLYSISAEDSSGNESLRTPGLHSTIYSELLYDSCQNTITIKWNKYIGWDDNVSGYIIYWKSGNNSFQILDGVGFDDSLYIHRNIIENNTYTYFVEALNYNGLISRSNKSSKFAYMPSPPEELVLDFVTISGENEAEIQFHSSDTVYGFSLLRSSVQTSDFESIQQFYNEKQSNFERQDYILLDFILSNSEKFFYKIGSLNTCLQVDTVSNLGVNIVLSGVSITDDDDKFKYNILNWNEYIDWGESGVEDYKLFRSESSGDWILLDILGKEERSYNDFLTNFTGSNLSGEMVYRLEAKKSGEEIYSISNLVILKVISDLYMPNAFTPNRNSNYIFRPIFLVTPDKFTMIIYDRSGIPLFQSNDIDLGWDGTINGKGMAPQGVYMYHIQYTSFNGTKKSKTGTLTVFYP